MHPGGASDDLEIWIHRGYVPAGYAWSFPASGEVRVGVGSFDPRFHVKEPTVRLAEDIAVAVGQLEALIVAADYPWCQATVVIQGSDVKGQPSISISVMPAPNPT